MMSTPFSSWEKNDWFHGFDCFHFRPCASRMALSRSLSDTLSIDQRSAFSDHHFGNLRRAFLFSALALLSLEFDRPRPSRAFVQRLSEGPGVRPSGRLFSVRAVR